MAEQAAPEHRVVTGWTLALHGEEVGGLRVQETLGQANHVAGHGTGRLEAGQLFCGLVKEESATVNSFHSTYCAWNNKEE